jgi:hypothetical protein
LVFNGSASQKRFPLANLSAIGFGVKQKACSPPVSDFAVLDLSKNETRIVKHLQRNKDQLSRTETPLFHKNRSTMWVLANRLDAPRLAS